MAIEFEHFPQGGHKDESHVSEQMPSDKGRTGGTAKGGMSHTYSKTSHTDFSKIPFHYYASQ